MRAGAHPSPTGSEGDTVVGRDVAALVIAIAAWLVAGCDSSAPPASATPAGGSPVASSVATSPAATDSRDPSPSAATETPSREPVYQATEDLRIGDCYDPVEDADDGSLLAAIIVPCEEPHRAEIFGLEDLPGGPDAPFPGVVAVDDEAIDLCDAAFEAYVGVALDNSRYSYVYYTPTDQSWAGGDRVVMCSVDDRGRPIAGSVEGSER